MVENFGEDERRTLTMPPRANLQAGAREISNKIVLGGSQQEIDSRLLLDRSCLSSADFKELINLVNANLKKDEADLKTHLPHFEIGSEPYTFKVELVSPGKLFGNTWPNRHDVMPRSSFDKWAATSYDDFKEDYVRLKKCNPNASFGGNVCSWLEREYTTAAEMLPIELRLR